MESTTESKDFLKINIERLIPLLTCSLCKGIFRSPYTINECMHTFCKACIFKEFYSNPNTSVCPICKVNLGGKPLETLIFDHSINTLINILFPEFEKIDKENTEKMYEAFRNEGMPLPGDPLTDKKRIPNLQISILPAKLARTELMLPKIKTTKISVARSMDMQKFKAYLSLKLKEIDEYIDESKLVIYYKGQEMREEYSFYNIEMIYKFPEDQNEKIVFSYAKKD